jgi:hypothetical protein
MCWVDDFAFACANETLARDIVNCIRVHLQFADGPAPHLKHLGVQSYYNGLNMEQSSAQMGA